MLEIDLSQIHTCPHCQMETPITFSPVAKNGRHRLFPVSNNPWSMRLIRKSSNLVEAELQEILAGLDENALMMSTNHPGAQLDSTCSHLHPDGTSINVKFLYRHPAKPRHKDLPASTVKFSSTKGAGRWLRL